MRTMIIDSQLGNVRSVANMLRRIGRPGELISAPVQIGPQDRIILPGVGAFDAGMAALETRGLDDFVLEAASAGCEILGICLGMQLLTRGSEEGDRPGLGLVPGEVRRMAASQGLRIPHMGWNVAMPPRPSRLFEPSADEQRFYFVHGYQVVCDDEADVAARTPYGIDFVSAFERGPLMGVQFHPEKSHRFGMTLLGRFTEPQPLPAAA